MLPMVQLQGYQVALPTWLFFFLLPVHVSSDPVLSQLWRLLQDCLTRFYLYKLGTIH